MGHYLDLSQSLPQLLGTGDRSIVLDAADVALAPGFALIVVMPYKRDEQPVWHGFWFVVEL